MNWATLKQSVARGTGESVTALAIEQLGVCDAPGLVERVSADLRARTDVGVETYGFPLFCDNGRDPLIDAYQEALDLYKYLTQAVAQGYPVADAHARARQLVISLCAALIVCEQSGLLLVSSEVPQ